MALDNEFLTMDVFPEMTLNDLKAMVEDDIKVPGSSQHYFLNNELLTEPTRTLEQLNVNEGDMLGLAVRASGNSGRRRAEPSTNSQSRQPPHDSVDPERLRTHMLSDQRVLAEVRSKDPELADASDNPERFRTLWDQRRRQASAAQAEKEEQIALLEADPFNVEAQAKIEEMIRQQGVQENIQRAFEENPEGKYCHCQLSSSTDYWQRSQELQCCTSMSSSIILPSKPSSIRARRLLSCLLVLPNDVASGV